MSPLRGVLLAIDLATRRREEASVALVRARQAELQAREQLEQLQAYAHDTEMRWALPSRASASPDILRHFDQFMERLRQAMEMQGEVVRDQGRATDAARQVLADAEMRLSGLRRVLDGRRAALSLAARRLEQKQLDELAAVQFRRTHHDPRSMETP